MARREFPRSVKVAVIRRATRGGIVFCEKCGAMAKRWQIDHVRPDGLLGDQHHAHPAVPADRADLVDPVGRLN